MKTLEEACRDRDMAEKTHGRIFRDETAYALSGEFTAEKKAVYAAAFARFYSKMKPYYDAVNALLGEDRCP